MFHLIRNWFRRPTPAKQVHTRSIEWTPSQSLSTTSHSSPYLYENVTELGEQAGLIQPTAIDPRYLFPMLRRLRDFIPDVSAGVWAWVRLCSTPQSYTVANAAANCANEESAQRYARQIIEELDRRIYACHSGQERGIEALVQSFFLSVFTYGSFCGEVVLEKSRRRIERFVVIDPATIRFKLDSKERINHPYQIQPNNSLVKLNPATFFYFGLDTDGLSPYGRSPLLALPLVVKLQQQMMHDMAKAQHNAGYPTIHFKLQKPDSALHEANAEYHERLNQLLSETRSEAARRETDSNLVTFDDIEVNYLGPHGNTMQWSESIQAISEQVISALHLAPFMIGRNWGTTQTWGTAQYQLLTNNARTVQEGAKRLAEWLRNLELILQESPLSVTHHFAPHHHLDVLDRAKAFQTTSKTLTELVEKKLLEETDARQRIENLMRYL